MRDLSFARAIAFARDLIRIPSLPGAEADLAARVRAELETLAFDDVQVDPIGNVIARVRGTGGGPTVMLSCHLDAVDVGELDSWEHPPFDAVLDSTFLHGRGAMDIKGPLALQTYAAAALLERRPPGDVIVAHTVLEERGGLGMARLMDSGSVRPDAVIIGEATGGDICIGHRGRAEIVIHIHGVAGHASAPERARNPLDVLPDVLRALRSFAAALEADPVLGRSTLAPTAIETLPRSRNVIPDLVRVTLDWRVLPGSTREQLLARIERHIRNAVNLAEPFRIDVAFGVDVQTTYTGHVEARPMHTPGYLLPADHPIATAAAAAVARAAGHAPAVRPWTFATDGGHTCGVHGVPTLGFGPGVERWAHTNRERLELAAAQTVYHAYPAVITAVQAAARCAPLAP